MQKPTLLSTNIHEETFAGVTYHLQGELVPVLTVELSGTQTVFFEHHIMLWKNTSINIGLRPMKGAIKRMFAGLQIFITEARGKGQIAFSRDGVGQIIPIHLNPGQHLDVREHQFLGATGNIEYGFTRMKGFANILMGATGFFIDRFSANQSEGILWIHGYGNVFEKHLENGEQIDVEPGAWLYKDTSVRMETSLQRFSTGLFSGSTFICNRFTGPGRVGIQSMSVVVPKPEKT